MNEHEDGGCEHGDGSCEHVNTGTVLLFIFEHSLEHGDGPFVHSWTFALPDTDEINPI